jgi:hypothetical protein
MDPTQSGGDWTRALFERELERREQERWATAQQTTGPQSCCGTEEGGAGEFDTHTYNTKLVAY